MCEDYQYTGDFDYDKEFWGEEPSELEMQIAAFRDSIIRGVKAEITEELERLRKENAELREFKRTYNEQIRELNSLKSRYEDALRDAKKKVEKETLRELLAPLFQTAYGIGERSVYLFPKCDRCNDKRMIRFKSPLGNECVEHCLCSLSYFESFPQPIEVVKFGDSRYVNTGNIRYRFAYYVFHSDPPSCGSEQDNYTLLHNIVQPGADYEPEGYRDPVFLDIDDAEKYCESRNARAKEDALKKYEDQKAKLMA